MSKNTNKPVHAHSLTGKRTEFGLRALWKQRNLAIPLLLVLSITTLVYAHALQNGFLGWDDPWQVTNNKDIQSLSTSNIKNIFSSFYGNMYHPVTTLTFAVEYKFFGLNPAVYHATNVLFHLANVVLVFFLVFRLSNRRETAIIAACLFGIHPMHVESVAWITERKDVVYAFFYLLALICYVRYIQRDGKKYYWYTLLFFVFSLLSKATAITLPIVLILIDIYLHRKIKTRTLNEKLPLFVLSIVFGIVSFYSQDQSIKTAVLQGSVFTDRFFLASYAISYYIVHLFVPIDLSALHLLPEKANGLLPVEYYLAVIPLLVIVFLTLRKGMFRREFVLGFLFFITILSLNVHIVPFGRTIVSDRYTYLPYVGLYYLIGQLYCYTVDRYQKILFAWKRVIIAVGSLVIIFFGYITYQRIGVWGSTQVLFNDASMKARSVKEGNSILVMGYELEGLEKTISKNFFDAIKWYDKAIALNPQSAELFSNRGIAKHCLLDYEEAMKDYTKAVELNPSYIQAYTNRAAIYFVLNRKQEACADLRAAYNLGSLDVFEKMQADCR